MTDEDWKLLLIIMAEDEEIASLVRKYAMAEASRERILERIEVLETCWGSLTLPNFSEKL
jgi:hypothetical protein